MLVKLVHRALRVPCGRSISSSSSRLCQQQILDPVQVSLMEAESCILTDGDDKAIGHASKKFCHTVQNDGSLPLHRAFSVFLFNSDNELLLQKRSANKVSSQLPFFWGGGTCSPKGIVWFWSRWKAPPYGEIHRPPPCCTTRTRQYLLDC